MKRACAMCGVHKRRSDFGSGKRSDGTHSYCRPCYNAYKRSYYARNREREVARSVIWNYRNMDRFLQNMRRYQRTAKAKSATKAWIAKNKDKRRSYDAKKRAIRVNALACSSGWFNADQWKRMLAKYHRRCAYCGISSKRLTRDHVIPLVRGGQHVASNIVPACYSCNSRKQALTGKEFRAKLRSGYYD